MSLLVNIQYLGFFGVFVLCCFAHGNRSMDGFFDEPLTVGDGRLKSNPFM